MTTCAYAPEGCAHVSTPFLPFRLLLYSIPLNLLLLSSHPLPSLPYPAFPYSILPYLNLPYPILPYPSLPSPTIHAQVSTEGSPRGRTCAYARGCTHASEASTQPGGLRSNLTRQQEGLETTHSRHVLIACDDHSLDK